MNAADDVPGKPGSAPLSELFSRYLRRQADDQAAGLAAEAPGEVVPFEAAPAPPVEPRAAWLEAVAILPHYHSGAVPTLAVPPDWPGLVAAQEPTTAVAFCLGNFPQMVRAFQPLLHAESLASPRSGTNRPASLPTLADWAALAARQPRYPEALLALGCLRLAGQFDLLHELVLAVEKAVPEQWRPAWENERAANAWHAGRREEAQALWQAQTDRVPVLFNRGMAALFLGQPPQAHPWLTRAVAELPETSAWHHLGQLYLALADGHA